MAQSAKKGPSRLRNFMEKYGAPVMVGVLFIAFWDGLVRINDIPHYVLPGPFLVFETLIKDWHTLYPSLLVTLTITLSALFVATVAGVGTAVLFAQSRIIERSLFPFTVMLQVTPIVAIAPLIIIWVNDIQLSLLVCAWIVAFFPIISNTTLGLNSTNHNLLDLLQLYGATRRQSLWFVRLPSALPFFLAGLRISGGLALIGAVVAEFVAGTGGNQSGLAFRILEAGYTLQIPRMFAALMLITASGVMIYIATSLIAYFLLHKWHESAITREG